ncbi:hypothetical protein [Pseudomonas mosselii]|uniref:hypothetical protein n=1 Tax=Pseudomonas mosselii TaxID=78327 RepID=UPI0021DA4E3C|nr:hypothetical protein [Pseudomonas mosselii]MCU9527525.1 hypothetical protein [Pseudomonas mosselii]MCU9534838.1 hypothetical protein [Pseudomonas mosselii]MCU9542772.1 hypothetical protein [Pseudomonas mosselii]MCU9546678.1 hypothetical protein [Pseudomonas mosselii]
MEIEKFLVKLRLDPSDVGGPSRMDLLRERQEAADLIDALANALGNAESACEKALAGFGRWQSGKPFEPSGPESEIKDQLYDVIRPGARTGMKKLAALLDVGTVASSGKGEIPHDH